VAHRIALLAGDGVGPEVMAEARKALDALGVSVDWTELDWGSAHWHRHGTMMPADWEEAVRGHDAVFMGAVGDPSVPDHLSIWGLPLQIRQRLDLWANVRPARLLPGIPTPLAGRGPSDIDMVFLRENTEGEYSGAGGRVHSGHREDTAVEVSVFTRAGVERIARYAFQLAEQRRGLVTSATKSNASRHAYVFWDEVVGEVAAEHPDVRYERVLVDALTARIVRSPDSLDVVVASNLFGDILTDLAAAIQGGLGMAASANIAPDRDVPGLFEPVHGSAPDIAGQGIANPAGAIWSAAMMLDHLGEAEAAARLMRALEDVCREGPRTRDVGGSATTVEVGDAVAARLAG
jgi:tartrate dehydrogenase/decarboxylase/D-malate dehydrogenase